MISFSILKLANFILNSLIFICSLVIILLLFSEGFSFVLIGFNITVHQFMHPLGFLVFFAYIKYLVSPVFQLRIHGLLNNLIKNPYRIATVMVSMCSILVFLLLMHERGARNSLWDLDSELGYATGFSFLLFASVTGLTTVISVQEKRLLFKSNLLWFPLILIFGYLAVDEIASIHETLGSRFIELLPNFLMEWNHLEWLKLFFPFILLAVGLLIFFSLKKLRAYKIIFILFYFALAFFMFSIIGETIMLELELKNDPLYQLEIMVEEGSEMLGTALFLLCFLLYYRQKFLVQCQSKKNPSRSDLPPQNLFS